MQLTSIMESAFDRYADRPALAERRSIPTTNHEIHAAAGDVLSAYEFLTYAALQRRTRSVTAQLTSTAHLPRGLDRGDRIALLGFAGIDFTTVDLASNLAGITTVPLQTSGTYDQHRAIVTETAPRAIAATVTLLERAARLMADHPSLERLLVLDYRGNSPEHRKVVAAVQQDLAVTVELLDLDRNDEPQPDWPATTDGTAMLLYTSGSTGTPKGAIYTERLVAEMWGGEGWSEFFAEKEQIASFHYMPMSHVAGHSSVRSTLARGGVTYFASTANLSSIFEDLSLARPTELSLVPRICELLHQEFQRRLRAAPGRGGQDEVSTDATRVLADMREQVLGGNVQWSSCTSAPVSAELKSFMESLLGIELHELYGTTEIGGVLADGRFLSPPVIDYALADVPDLGYFTTDRPAARGELLIKSTSTIPGYYNRPELNSEVFTADGYYRTGDIAAVDPEGRVRIIDRRNAIIKLSQGEFVALPSLEATYVAGSSGIHQAFLFGQSDQSSIIAVCVPSDRLRAELDDDIAAIGSHVLHELRTTAAREGLNSYEIPSAVLVEFEPFSESNGLLSDHRKPVRPRLAEKYGARLQAMYHQLRASRDEILDYLREHGAADQTLTTLRRAIAVSIQTDPNDIASTARFRDLGGDSLSAVYLARLLEQIYDIRLSVDTVASESYTIRELADHIDVRRRSDTGTVSFEEIHGDDPDQLRAADLTIPRFVTNPSTASDRPRTSTRPVSDRPSTSTARHTILVTGASGHLGRFVCLELLRQFSGTDDRVVCLVRAASDSAARDRLRRAYATSDALLSEFDRLATNLDVLAGDLSQNQLGLDNQIWERLVHEVTEIIHSGAMVNHALPYRDLFAANVAGTAEVIRLAVTGGTKPLTFMSSIAVALLPGPSTPLDEPSDIRDSLPVVSATGGIVDGYAATKWAGEILLRSAHEQYGLPVTIFRASMILAHSSYPGQINVPDTFTRLLYSLIRTGLAPSSFYRGNGHDAHYDGLPVDVVSKAVTALRSTGASETLNTFHLVNPFDDGVSLDQMVEWLNDMGVALTRIDTYEDWFSRFSAALRTLNEHDRRSSVLPILEAFRRPEEPVNGSLIRSTHFTNSLAASESPMTLSPLTHDFLRKCVGDIKGIFDLTLPQS